MLPTDEVLEALVMKIRKETRVPVSLSARLRLPTGWSDAEILDLSNNGLMLSSSADLFVGQVVELRRGPHVVFARIMWAKDGCFGAVPHQQLSIGALVNFEAKDRTIECPVERRAIKRSPFFEENDHLDGAGLLRTLRQLAIAAIIVGALLSFAFDPGPKAKIELYMLGTP